MCCNQCRTWQRGETRTCLFRFCFFFFMIFLPPLLKDSWRKHTKPSVTELVKYCSAFRLSSYVLACVVDPSQRAEAALGLFSAPGLSTLQQSSSGCSNARKRLCTSASRERGRIKQERETDGGRGVKGLALTKMSFLESKQTQRNTLVEQPEGWCSTPGQNRASLKRCCVDFGFSYKLRNSENVPCNAIRWKLFAIVTVWNCYANISSPLAGKYKWKKLTFSLIFFFFYENQHKYKYSKVNT